MAPDGEPEGPDAALYLHRLFHAVLLHAVLRRRLSLEAVAAQLRDASSADRVFTIYAAPC